MISIGSVYGLDLQRLPMTILGSHNSIRLGSSASNPVLYLLSVDWSNKAYDALTYDVTDVLVCQIELTTKAAGLYDR